MSLLQTAVEKQRWDLAAHTIVLAAARVDRLDYELASGVNGIDDEIALLRVEIKKAISGGDVGNLQLLVKATNALERLIRTRYQITREQRKGLKEAISNVLKDIAIPLGINIGASVIGRQIGR
jgi:hypothetical protein